MKKKGSALVFSILLLSFFLGISLILFFLAQKRSRNTSAKVVGEQFTNNIDIASSLGYQELSIAESLVRSGVLYDNTHDLITSSTFDNATYSPSIGSKSYLNSITGDYDSNSRYAGIQINDLIDYFSSNWDYTLGGASDQKLIISETISTKVPLVVDGRVWQSGGVSNKLTPLWSTEDSTSNSKKISVGGYRLTSLTVNGVSFDFSDSPKDFIMSELVLGTQNLSASYTKNMRFQEDSSYNLPEINIKIIVTEDFQATRPGSSNDFDDLVFFGRSIDNFEIITLD